MDLPLVIAQLGAAAQQAGPALDLGSKAAEVGVTTNILTNLAKGIWGGDVRTHPPDWFAPLCAVVLGVILTAVAAVAIGLNLADVRTLGGVLLAGIPLGGGTSFAVQGVSNAGRPRPQPPMAGQICPTCGQQAVPGPTQGPPISSPNVISAPGRSALG